MQRMSKDGVPLKILNGHPGLARRRGWPRGRWKGAVESNPLESKRLENVGAELVRLETHAGRGSNQ